MIEGERKDWPRGSVSAAALLSLVFFALVGPASVRGQTLDQFYNQAQAALQEGRFQDAAAIYQQAIQRYPGQAPPLVGLGYALAQLGQLDQAQGVLERALAMDPNSSDAHTNLGFVYWQKGNREAAVAEYTTATRLNPSNAMAFYNLGHSYLSMGSPAQAMNPLQRALDLQPDFVEALITLGWARVAGGDPQGALEPLNRAVSLAPNRADAHYHLGLALGQAGHPEAARFEEGWLEANHPELAPRFRQEMQNAPVRARANQALPTPEAPVQEETDPSITLLGTSANEGREGWDQPGYEDTIVGSWYGTFKGELYRDASGELVPSQLGEAVLTITKVAPGQYQVRVSQGWIQVDDEEGGLLFQGCVLHFQELGQDIIGQPIFRYQGNSGSFYRNGTPKAVRITLQPGFGGPSVRATVGDAESTDALTPVGGGG